MGYSCSRTHKSFIIHVCFIFKCPCSLPSPCCSTLCLLRQLLWRRTDTGWRTLVRGELLDHVPVQHVLLFREIEKFNVEDQITVCHGNFADCRPSTKKLLAERKYCKKKVVTFSRNETFCMRFHCQFVLEQAPQTNNDSANQKTFWATNLFFPTINSSNIRVPKNDFSLRRKEFSSHLKFRSYTYHLNRHEVQFSYISFEWRRPDMNCSST